MNQISLFDLLEAKSDKQKAKIDKIDIWNDHSLFKTVSLKQKNAIFKAIIDSIKAKSEIMIHLDFIEAGICSDKTKLYFFYGINHKTFMVDGLKMKNIIRFMDNLYTSDKDEELKKSYADMQISQLAWNIRARVIRNIEHWKGIEIYKGEDGNEWEL